MASMFGVIVAGRLVKTDAQPVSENQVLFEIEDCDNVNHIVVFLTGFQPFPDGFGGSVYFCWPAPVPAWRLLGFITNDKPSAIFKIAKMKTPPNEAHPFGENPFEHNAHVARIGISIEPLAQIAYETPDVASQASKTETLAEFSEKVVTNLFNYCTSFAVTPQQMNLSSETYVPLTTLKNWYTTFQRRLSLDHNFWKSL